MKLSKFVNPILIIALSLTLVPNAAFAQTTDYKAIDVKISLYDLDEVIFASDAENNVQHEPTTDPRVEPLRAYLESKNSPMAPYAEQLLQNYHYRLIIGISFAESNFCKRNIKPHNCWGIGGGKPEIYKDYPAAFERANELIQKYHDSGLTSPDLMRNRWVGWKNNNWPIAVKQVTKQLETLGI